MSFRRFTNIFCSNFHSVDNATCPICLMLFQEAENAVHLECGHFFHGDCIRTWLRMVSAIVKQKKKTYSSYFTAYKTNVEYKSQTNNYIHVIGVPKSLPLIPCVVANVQQASIWFHKNKIVEWNLIAANVAQRLITFFFLN